MLAALRKPMSASVACSSVTAITGMASVWNWKPTWLSACPPHNKRNPGFTSGEPGETGTLTRKSSHGWDASDGHHSQPEAQ